MYSVEEFDELKIKMMHYITYKKRTKQEIKQKFSEFDGQILEDAIEYFEEAGYIDDKTYINKSINEFMRLKNLSLKEVQYKLLSKGIGKNEIEDYFSQDIENLNNYEVQSAKNILIKKAHLMELDEIQEYLYKKGYLEENIKTALNELENM